MISFCWNQKILRYYSNTCKCNTTYVVISEKMNIEHKYKVQIFVNKKIKKPNFCHCHYKYEMDLDLDTYEVIFY